MILTKIFQNDYLGKLLFETPGEHGFRPRRFRISPLKTSISSLMKIKFLLFSFFFKCPKFSF